jgi:hypothetical protein
MKVVINRCFGGFGLSRKVVDYMADRGHALALEEQKGEDYARKSSYESFLPYIERTDPLLVEAVEVLGKEANGGSAKLEVEDVSFRIQDFIINHDGIERIEFPLSRGY